MTSLAASMIGLGTAALILLLMRRDRLHVRHGLTWIVIALVFALLGLMPGIIDWIAGKVGVAYPPILAVIIAIALLVLKILRMDIEHTELEVRHQRLVQRLAMLEGELDRRDAPKRLPSTTDGDR